MSPTLCNMAAECLSKMVRNAQKNDLIVGMAPDLIDKGIAILQYADDTVICFEHNVECALNIKLLLYVFELMSGLKINYSKSEIFLIGGDNNIVETYVEMFGCRVGTLPLLYLGMPVSFRCIGNSDLEYVDERCVRKLDAWQGNAASSGVI